MCVCVYDRSTRFSIKLSYIPFLSLSLFPHFLFTRFLIPLYFNLEQNKKSDTRDRLNKSIIYPLKLIVLKEKRICFLLSLCIRSIEILPIIISL